MEFAIENNKIIGNLEFGQLSISPNQDFGFRPYELFISSIIGCSGTLLRNILTKKRLPFEEIVIEVSSIRNAELANKIEEIFITANVQSDWTLNEDQLDKIAQLVIKNCGMIQSVIDSIKINFIIQTVSVTGNNN